MADLVRADATSEKLRMIAVDIVRSLYCSGPEDYIRAVDTFCRQWVMLIHEPDEILVTPLRMLEDIEAGRAAGDCDDVSMLAAALLTALGIACRFKAVFPSAEGHYQHVFAEYRLGEGLPWLPMDLTINHWPEYPPQWITVEI